MLIESITWALNHRVWVLAGAAAVAFAGFLSLNALNIDAFPDTTPVQVQINTAVPALVPIEVERQITLPIELAMSGMPGLQQLRSISQFGLSQIVVTFQDGTDIYFARQLINERITNVEMPPGIDRPQMGPVSTGLGEVFHYLLTSDGKQDQDLMQLRTAQDWIVKPSLRSVPGTAEVNSWGGLKKQYQVCIDPQRLFKHDLTFHQVVEAVRANNLNVGGGNITRSGDMLLVHGIGRTTNVPQIEEIVIAAKQGVPIYVKDVADIVIGHETRRGVITANGKGEAVLGLGFMLMGENSFRVTKDLRTRFEESRSDIPAGIRGVTVYDRTELVDRVIDTVRNNLADGALLVIALLFVFLGNLRAGLVAAVAIPISMLFAFCGMYQAGVAGTLLSLGAIDFGIVVDSSVVVIENIVRRLGHLTEGQASDRRTRLQTIREATIEVRTPAVFGQLIIMIVYIPILTLEGVEGKMFRPMAITVVFVLIGSLIASLTLIPVLASLLLPKRISEGEPWFLQVAQRLYAAVLQVTLRRRSMVLASAAGVLILTGYLALGLGSEFVPRLSEGSIVVGVLRPPGTSLSESTRINTLMEQALLKAFPDEVDHLWSRQGAPEVATDPGSIESTDVFITLTPPAQWTKATTQGELVSQMEAELRQIPGQTIWFTQPIEMRINEMLSGVRADVAVKLFGNDFELLGSKGKELESVLRSIPGSADISTEQISGQPILQIRIDQDQIARYGISAEAVLSLVEAVGGTQVGEIVEDQLRFPLTIRLPETLRASPETIAGIMLAAPSGERIPLSRLAEIREVRGPKTISREWGKRRTIVQCNVRGRDVGSFVAEAQRRIASEVTLPETGYRIEWGGQFENMRRAQQRLLIVVPLVLLLIIGLLYFTYRSTLDAGIVFASVPFACVGGILALWGRGMPLSIAAAVGLITLSGVSVLSSMILVSSLRSLIAGGSNISAAVAVGTSHCLRTVLMTSLVASVGFIPMAVSTATGAEVQRPLATVVIGGVISSALFTLFVLPALYAALASQRLHVPISLVQGSEIGS